MPTFDHYTSLWNRWGMFFDGLFNSTIVTAGATALAISASTCAGYVYSRNSGRFLDASVLFLIIVRLIPPIVVTLPLFPDRQRHWPERHAHRAHRALRDLLRVAWHGAHAHVHRPDPARAGRGGAIDGATRMTILRRVIVPLAAPGILAVAVFVVVFSWNEFLFAFIFTATKAKTAPLVISEMIGSIDGVDWGILFAASTVQLVPVLLFVVLMNRYLVAGLTAGATKG